MEATLDRAPALGQVPLVLDATWTDAPLGAVSRILSARDAGVRGQMNLSAQLRGVFPAPALHLRLQLSGVHRADFVPEQTLAADIECSAQTAHALHTFDDLRCLWPVPGADGDTIAMTGSVPDALDLRSAPLQIGTPHLSAPVLLIWLRALSERIPPTTALTGSLAATASHPGGSPLHWTGRVSADTLTIAGGRLGLEPLATGPVSLETDTTVADTTLTAQLAPVDLPLGGHDPALLEGRVTPEGYTLHLSGLIAIPRLLALGASLPQFGDGLAEALPKNRGTGSTRLELAAHRSWGGPQLWTDTLTHPASPAPRKTPAKRRVRRR